MAGGVEVPRSRWCAEAAGYNPDRLPPINNVAEFLEEGLQLLLLGRRQVCGDRRQAMWAGSGWWRWRVSNGDDLQNAHCLPGMQAKRFWAEVVDRDPHFGSTSKRRHSGHKCG